MKQMDTMLFQQSQSIDDIKNRLNCIESGAFSESGLDGLSGLHESSELDLDQIKPALMSDNDFVSGIVDNIMTNSNLSEVIEQIDTVQSETRELRELLHAQQKTINEMNIMLLKLISQSLVPAATAALIPATAALNAAPAPAVAEDERDEDETGVAVVEAAVVGAAVVGDAVVEDAGSARADENNNIQLDVMDV